jgi:hypothetical protein
MVVTAPMAEATDSPAAAAQMPVRFSTASAANPTIIKIMANPVIENKPTLMMRHSHLLYACMVLLQPI